MMLTDLLTMDDTTTKYNDLFLFHTWIDEKWLKRRNLTKSDLYGGVTEDTTSWYQVGLVMFQRQIFNFQQWGNL